MRRSGRIWKAGKDWLLEVPVLDAMTEGRTRTGALRMNADLIETMVAREVRAVRVGRREAPRGEFEGCLRPL